MILRSMKKNRSTNSESQAVQLSGLRQQSEGPGRGRKGRRKGPIVPLKERGIAGKDVPQGIARAPRTEFPSRAPRTTWLLNGDSNMLTISGGNDEGVPPVPIPNTEVKPFSADGTWLVTARESRSPPDSTNKPLAFSRWFFYGIQCTSVKIRGLSARKRTRTAAGVPARAPRASAPIPLRL